MTDESRLDRLTFAGAVVLFPQEGGWHYLAVPSSISAALDDRAERGVIAVSATIASTTWETSLLPMGDGSHFIAINARIRRVERIALGDRVTAHVSPRER